MLKKTVRNSVFISFSTLVSLLLGFLFAGMIIRYLGDQRAGFLLTLQSVLALGGTVGGLGFGAAAIRKVAAFYKVGDLAQARSCLGAVFFLNLFTGLLIIIGILVGFPWFFEWSKIDQVLRVDAFYAAIFIALTFVLQQISMTYALTYTALERFDLIASLGAGFGLLNGILGLLTLWLFPKMGALASLSFVLAVVQLSINVVLVRHLLHGNIVPAWNPLELRSMIGFGTWAWLANLGGIINSSVDKITLTTFLGSASLPYYVVGQRMISQVHAALASQSQFIFPMLAAQGEQAGLMVNKVEDKLRWFMAFASAGIYGLLAIISYPLLAKIVGVEFANRAIIPFLLACIQGYLVAQSIVPYQISWGEGRGAPNAIFSLASGLLTISTIILMAPKYGILSASIAQLWIGPATLALISWIAVAGKRLSWKSVFRPFCSPTITYLTLLGIAMSSWLLRFHTRFIDWVLMVVVAGFVILFGLFIEWFFFRKYGCIESLKSVINLLISRLQLFVG